MSKILERYASAANAHDLRATVTTMFSNTDVLAAMGRASRDEPLGQGLLRLITGDNSKRLIALEVIADEAWRHARRLDVKMSMAQAVALASAAIDWLHKPGCQWCNGTGTKLEPWPGGGWQNVVCFLCNGMQQRAIRVEVTRHAIVAQWLADELLRELGRVSAAAMHSLA